MGVESNGVVIIPRFVKIGQLVQASKQPYRHRNIQHVIAAFLVLRKESRSICLQDWFAGIRSARKQHANTRIRTCVRIFAPLSLPPHLPHSFWDHAFLFSTHLLNITRTPSRLPIKYIGIVQAERESGRGPMPPSY
jgi:hypothetical protein